MGKFLKCLAPLGKSWIRHCTHPSGKFLLYGKTNPHRLSPRLERLWQGWKVGRQLGTSTICVELLKAGDSNTVFRGMHDVLSATPLLMTAGCAWSSLSGMGMRTKSITTTITAIHNSTCRVRCSFICWWCEFSVTWWTDTQLTLFEYLAYLWNAAMNFSRGHLLPMLTSKSSLIEHVGKALRDFVTPWGSSKVADVTSVLRERQCCEVLECMSELFYRLIKELRQVCVTSILECRVLGKGDYEWLWIEWMSGGICVWVNV